MKNSQRREVLRLQLYSKPTGETKLTGAKGQKMYSGGLQRKNIRTDKLSEIFNQVGNHIKMI